jgi:hypothetical protein
MVAVEQSRCVSSLDTVGRGPPSILVGLHARRVNLDKLPA